jgi:hypothetical protein
MIQSSQEFHRYLEMENHCTVNWSVRPPESIIRGAQCHRVASSFPRTGVPKLFHKSATSSINSILAGRAVDDNFIKVHTNLVYFRVNKRKMCWVNSDFSSQHTVFGTYFGEPCARTSTMTSKTSFILFWNVSGL